jgi:hypothetical protein
VPDPIGLCSAYALHLTLRQGTSQLTFDFSNVQSPMCFQILGLCDFAIPPVPGVGWFSLVP